MQGAHLNGKKISIKKNYIKLQHKYGKIYLKNMFLGMNVMKANNQIVTTYANMNE